MTSCAVTSQITHYIIYIFELCKLNQLEQDTHKMYTCIHACLFYYYCAFKTCTSYYVCSCVGVAQNYTRTWFCTLMLQMIICLLVIKIHSFICHLKKICTVQVTNKWMNFDHKQTRNHLQHKYARPCTCTTLCNTCTWTYVVTMYYEQCVKIITQSHFILHTQY